MSIYRHARKTRCHFGSVGRSVEKNKRVGITKNLKALVHDDWGNCSIITKICFYDIRTPKRSLLSELGFQVAGNATQAVVKGGNANTRQINSSAAINGGGSRSSPSGWGGPGCWIRYICSGPP